MAKTWVEPALLAVLAFLAGYGLGSIPFGLLLTRWAGAGDIRAIGSGNIGATNVLRTGRKGLALATLLLDLAKGAMPDRPGLRLARPAGRACWRVPAPSSATASRSGWAFAAARAWPPRPGVVLGLTPIAVPGDPGRRSSPSSRRPAGSRWARSRPPAWRRWRRWLLGNGWAAGLYLLVAALVVYKHRENIGRLLKGEENRLSFGGKPPHSGRH